jgi:FkbM family methyltransferase
MTISGAIFVNFKVTMKTKLTTFNGNTFALLENDAISQHIFRGEEWEPHFRQVCEFILKPGDVCVDLGANFGFHTVTMGKLVGSTGKVYSFEILRIIFQQLCANVFLNQLENVYTFNNAIHNKIDDTVKVPDVDFVNDYVNIGDTKIGSGNNIVLTKTLDSLNLEKLKFIKMDIQGCELFALQGGVKTIENLRPIIFIELEDPHLRSFGYDSKTLIEYLFSCGYMLARINNNYPCDHLAIPIEKEKEILDNIQIPYSLSILKGKKIDLQFDGPHGAMMYNNYKTYE